MDSLRKLGKLLNEFIPYHYDLVTGVKTALNPKPNFYFFDLREEQAFYINPTLEMTEDSEGNTGRYQIVYKHKEKDAGFGKIEARNIMKDLKKLLESKSIYAEINFLYVKFHNDFYIYSLNLTAYEDK